MRIAFIGSVGVPNRYGGFESFLEACAPVWVHDGHEIFVTCYSGAYTSREPVWKNVRRIFIPIPANGIYSIFHDLVAFFMTFWHSDAVVVLGVSGGIWFPLMRAFCAAKGVRLVVNIDGVEWRRKTSIFRRLYLYISDRIAQQFSHAVVYDNEALFACVLRNKKSDSFMIAYPGDPDNPILANDENPTSSARSVLTICRIEPENNCHVLLEAAASAGITSYVFIGNWAASSYGIRLRQRYGSIPGFHLMDPYYEKDGIANYRRQCDVYLHGHSVGGTNPSLVEMLFYDCDIIAFDCPYNRATGGAAISYFSNIDDLRLLLSSSSKIDSSMRGPIRERYTRERICNEYISILKRNR